MSDEPIKKTKPKEPAKKKYTALKNLCTANGKRVTKDSEVMLNKTEADYFKLVKAI